MKKTPESPATWPALARELYQAFYRQRQQHTVVARYEMFCLDGFFQYQGHQGLGFRDFPLAAVEDYLRRFGPARRRNVLGTLRAWLRFLYRRKELLLPLHESFQEWVFPSYERRSALSHAQVLQIFHLIPLDHPNGLRDRAFLEMAYGTAMRRGEMLGLELGDLDLAGATLFVQKAKSRQQRRVPLTRWALHYLQRYLADARPHLSSPLSSNTLWLNDRGGPLDAGRIGHRLAKVYQVRKRLGFAFTLHQLRHAAATHLLTAGASLLAVKELLGHVELNSTAIYTHRTPVHLVQIHDRCHPRNQAEWAGAFAEVENFEGWGTQSL
jgi:integrase/recombinase XerD